MIKMQINTKFNINDEVYAIMRNKIQKYIIATIDIFIGLNNEIQIEYSVNGDTGNWEEDKLFSSKEELIKSL